MSLAAHDDEVGPLLGSRLFQLGRRVAGTNQERPGDVEWVQRQGGPLARQLFDRVKRLLWVVRHGHGGRRPRHRRHMADMHGRELGTEVRGEPSCDPGCLDAAVGAINTENDSVHCCTSPSSSQPPGAWRPAHLMASSSTNASTSAGYWAAAAACDQFQLLPAAGVAAVMA